MIARPLVIGEGTPVFIKACDQISGDGIASQLHALGVEVVGSPEEDDAVTLLVVEELDEETIGQIRGLRRGGVERLAAVVTRVEDTALTIAIEAGLHALILRRDANARNLAELIRRVAAGEGSLTDDLLGRLFQQVGRLQREAQNPSPLVFTGLAERERLVLGLLADGCDTAEVGQRLFYSERTVKNIIHDINCRLNLRNRTHAVAFAIRHNLI